MKGGRGGGGGMTGAKGGKGRFAQHAGCRRPYLLFIAAGWNFQYHAI